MDVGYIGFGNNFDNPVMLLNFKLVASLGFVPDPFTRVEPAIVHTFLKHVRNLGF